MTNLSLIYSCISSSISQLMPFAANLLAICLAKHQAKTG